jgi:hypothetical protein
MGTPTVKTQMKTPAKTKGLFSPFAFSTHDPAGSLVVVNTKQPSITLTFTGVSISNPARCSQ